MNIDIELTENDLKTLVKNYIEEKFNSSINEKDIKILIKSKQNYRSEWELADFKATYRKSI